MALIFINKFVKKWVLRSQKKYCFLWLIHAIVFSNFEDKIKDN